MDRRGVAFRGKPADRRIVSRFDDESQRQTPGARKPRAFASWPKPLRAVGRRHIVLSRIILVRARRLLRRVDSIFHAFRHFRLQTLVALDQFFYALVRGILHIGEASRITRLCGAVGSDLSGIIA